MSSNEEAPTLAGHPPAVKVGGMRVARPRRDSEKSDSALPKTEEELHASSFSTFKPPVLVEGIPPKPGPADIPKADTKHAHVKPVPTHEQPHNSKPAVIQQPRK